MAEIDRIRQIHDSILRRGRTGPYRERPWTNPKTGRTRNYTFCNYATLEGLERLGINTRGLRAGRHPGPNVTNIRQDAYTANGMFNYMNRQSLRPNGSWIRIQDRSFTQQLANLGVTAVAAYRNPVRNQPGHVALVRPGPASWLRNLAAPFLTNIGNRNNTGVIPHTRSHGSNFQFFVNRRDPILNRMIRTAAHETRPGFVGPPSPSTSWLTNTLRTAYHETRPNFVGPPRPSTMFIRDLGIIDTFRRQTRPNFVGPRSSSTNLLNNLSLGFR